MSTENSNDRSLFSRTVTVLEDILYTTDDELLMAAPGTAEVAHDARTRVEAALRAARAAGAKRSVPELRSRRGDRRPAPRTVVQKLLVASPRARDIVGKGSVEGMTDAEIEAALERLATSGVLPEGA